MGEQHASAAVHPDIFRRAKKRASDYRRSIPLAPFYLCYDAFLFTVGGSLEHRNLADGPNFVMGDAIGRYENRMFGIVRDKIEIHLVVLMKEQSYWAPKCPSQPSGYIEIIIR